MEKTKDTAIELSQLDKVKDAARELECDEDEATFKGELKNIAKAETPKDNNHDK